MKIILFGYGKMGKLIEPIAQRRGHEIIQIIDSDNASDWSIEDLKKADIAIDFSTPDAVLTHIQLCFDAQIPVVVGTTGWHENLDQIKELCLLGNNTLLYGSNFSIGVNVLFHINKILAKVMEPYRQYDVQLEEIHHLEKLDSPSGTAITLAEGIIANNRSKTSWVNQIDEHEEEIVIKNEDLLIESHRMEEVPGTHTVLYSSEIDQIELKHIARNRKGFAYGAVIAAEWLLGKEGFFEISEMFDFNTSKI